MSPLLKCQPSLNYRRLGWTECWGGWSKESLEQWGLLAKLSTAGMMSTMGQWWSMEIAAGMAGTLGTISLAAHSCISNLLFFVFPFACAYPIVSSVALLVLPIESHVNGLHFSRTLSKIIHAEAPCAVVPSTQTRFLSQPQSGLATGWARATA